MKYLGRIIAVTFVFVGTSTEILFNYFYHGILDLSEMLGGLPYLPIAFWLGYQYDKAKFLSEKDFLTKLYNRRFVSQMIPKLLAQMDRKDEKLSVSILDCNNFKQINDTYGHKTGDLVLKNIAGLFINITRKSDVVARWGGDEFLFVAPFTDAEGTKEVLKRIEQDLLQTSHEMGIEISVSVGTAFYPDDANSTDDLLNMADKKMYKLKLMRKKQIEIDITNKDRLNTQV